jgi:hypothetical protein
VKLLSDSILGAAPLLLDRPLLLNLGAPLA